MKRILFLAGISCSLIFSYTRILMELDANVTFDLYTVTYPPLVFPTYYYPTAASAVNPRGIFLRVTWQRVGNTHSISDMYLATRLSGNFAPSVSANQLYFAPAGESQPPAGIDPPAGNWRAYNTVFQPIEQFPVAGPGPEKYDRPQDFVFKAELDDEAVIAAQVIHYRLYGL
jgi:hypothetical protein